MRNSGIFNSDSSSNGTISVDLPGTEEGKSEENFMEGKNFIFETEIKELTFEELSWSDLHIDMSLVSLKT